MRLALPLLRSAARRIDASSEGGTKRYSGTGVSILVGTLLVGVAAYGGIYLPSFSDGSREARNRANATGLQAARRRAQDDITEIGKDEKLKAERAPGSVWKNITIKREDASDTTR